ncbi:MAG: FAD-dependent oxidoreductase [Candidatus Eisenbacteria bacterium]|uniref:FAD-dependent oxidoreductase n=1 Tax=Eiseniibacteriota bacterium TaxID=2212470 RepID=A0A933S9G2_UNCEI|nr:FAD-dependent oxidoreductase [Candidatus Eisenbacteria bacterium]
MTHDVIIVGAGLAGLALAGELRERGHEPLVLERSRGVGGRCATRRVDDQPVDHGVGFLHGRDPEFLATLGALVPEAEAIAGWPLARTGAGTPCQPAAFGERGMRLAPRAGVNAFAKALARDASVRTLARVLTVALVPAAAGGREWEVAIEGERLRARALVTTQPVPGVKALLEPLAAGEPELRALFPLLSLVHPVPCLTLIARYGKTAGFPSWDAAYPEDSAIVQMGMNDSAKRGPGAAPTLVIQARPKWSRAHLEDAPEEWARLLLEEAVRLWGAGVGAPEVTQAHAWRHARVATGSELAAPLLRPLPGGPLLGVAGDGFHEAGGVEGAFLSGTSLARRLHHALVTHV